MKITHISDTHGQYWDLVIPPCDVLVITGDILKQGLRIQEVDDFNAWLKYEKQDGVFKHCIVIAGNHDRIFESQRELCDSRLPNAIYLEDSGVTIEGVKFYGAPWTPNFYDWAFMPERGKPMKAKWDLIPNDVDVLLTHGPAHGTLDLITGINAGCEELAFAIDRVKPKYHLFGHIHAGYGTLYKDGVNYINAAICTEAYRPDNNPITFEYGTDIDCGF